MRFSLQGQNPFLLVHDTEELLEMIVTLESFARADDNQLRPSTSEGDVQSPPILHEVPDLCIVPLISLVASWGTAKHVPGTHHLTLPSR